MNYCKYIRAYQLMLLISGSTISLATEANRPPIEIAISTKGDDIAFDKTAVQVPLDHPVKISFINKAAKGSEIFHNIAILKPGKKDQAIKLFVDAEYDVEVLKKSDLVIAISKTLGPGEQDTVSFNPIEQGFYTYICLVPGHADMMNMVGVLNVTAPQKK